MKNKIHKKINLTYPLDILKKLCCSIRYNRVILALAVPFLISMGLSCFDSRAEETGGELSLEVDYPEDIQCGQEVVFTMNAKNNAGECKYLINTIMVKVNGSYTSVVDPTKYSYTDSNQFPYTFVTSGDYYITARVMDFGTKPIRTASTTIKFTINDPSHPSVETISDNIVQECNSKGYTTDYDKALFFHDWILKHAEYDYSYKYMGEDGVLARGVGTCESYHRAFALLLGKVGIPCERATGNGHVWSCVKLDGEWTQVDPTWDDGDGHSGDSKFMDHLYFGITDDFMKLVHDEHKPVGERPCTSYQNNYFLRSGEISRWSEPVREEILQKISGNESSFTIEPPEKSPYPNVYHIIYPLVAYHLSNQNDWDKDISVEFTPDQLFSVTVNHVNHQWDDGEITRAATCTAEGVRSYTCTECKKTKTEIIPRLSHQPGGWTLNGSTQTKVQKCTKCGSIVETQNIGVSLNAASLPLQMKKSTNALKVKNQDSLDHVNSWSSSNPKIVTVNPQTGKLKAQKKKGTAYVTVTMQSGASASCRIKVQKGAVKTSKVSASPRVLTLKTGNTFQLSTTVAPLTSSQKISYTSSNKKTATVSSKGRIKAKKAGSTTITVKSGGKKVKVKVKVIR